MPTQVRDFSKLVARLCREFTELPRHRVERCVTDVSACVRHLGIEVTPSLVERIAREHLTGAVKSRPGPAVPSGRRTAP